MINLIIFGAPGAGKGTQCKILSEKLKLIHVSTGDLIRKEIVCQTELGKKAEKIINQGLLLDDSTVFEIFSNELKKQSDSKGFLFDGYPRTVKQAIFLDELLQELNLKLKGVINLVLPSEESIKRIFKRALIEGRSDDNQETVKQRLNEYNEKTAPLIEYYQKKGLIYNIDGIGSIEFINVKILETLKKIT